MFSLAQQNFYYYYFVTHIFTTILVDSTVVVPEKFQFTKWLVDYHISLNNDFLLYERPAWLWWFVLVECVGQLPAFFWFAYKLRHIWALRKASSDDKTSKMQLNASNKQLLFWLRVYGWNAGLTTLFCLYTVWTRGYYPEGEFLPMSVEDKLKLMAVYCPYLIIPLRLCFL
ncbi:LAME_0A03092g1_1 [Lachancea meyersii CBS 8951]|uniref:Efficient mitochondria targeting-associated protein 19 n=1 Tax=Lachancea meyersii CBS 8951 TaxID=1266667 RepID=A0A1G4IN68_9SACH|nr:LAME_0A03092g1_1 [Lachancea meyersii CBS 8951]